MAKKFGRRVKRSLTIGHLSDEGNDMAFWLSKTPLERLEATELMRQIIYDYDPATARVQRILTIIDREQS